MMMNFKSLTRNALVGAVFAVGGSSGGLAVMPANAQTAPAMQGVELTEQRVGDFVRSYPRVKELAGELEQEFDVPRSDSPAEGFGAFMQYQGAMGRMNSVVGEYGFASFMEWVQTMSSVVTAYTFAREGGGMDEQMAQALAQIDANPNFTEAQKTMMREQFAKASGSIAAIKPPQGNIDAVAAYSDELKVLLEDD